LKPALAHSSRAALVCRRRAAGSTARHHKRPAARVGRYQPGHL